MSFISDLLIEISSFRIRVGNKLNTLANRIGVLNNLTTNNKNSLVEAVNEVNGNASKRVSTTISQGVNWYRIARGSYNGGIGTSFIIIIERNYANANNESYTFSINTAYDGKTTITQLSGTYNDRILTKIRVVNTVSGGVDVDIFYNRSVSNTLAVRVIGSGEAVSATIAPTVTTGVTELDTVSGLSVLGNGNSRQWEQAYDWGNHALARYYKYVRVLLAGEDLDNIIINGSYGISSSLYASILNKPITTLQTAILKVFSTSNYLTQEYNVTSGIGLGKIFRRTSANNGVSWTGWLELYHSGNLPNIPAQVNLIQGAGISVTGIYPNLTITNSEPNVQADWNATSGLAQILNKPTYGTTDNTIAEGNDARINNGETAFSWGDHSTQGYFKYVSVIPSNSDLNTFTSIGIYRCALATVASVLNKPNGLTNAFNLVVMSSGQYLEQRLVVANSNYSYVRTNWGAGDNQYWLDWQLEYNRGNFNPAQYVLQSSLNTQLNNYATKAGTQTFTGTNTFTQAIYIPAATLNGHAVNLGQLNSILSNYVTNENVAYFNDVLNINTRVSWGTNVLAGERNQVQGGRNIVKGEDINVFGSRNISSGINNQINGFANVVNGAFNTLTGAYSSIAGSQANVIGNYLFARDNQTVLGMYNKVYDVGADEGLRFAFGTGSNDFDKFNAVEIYDDHRTGFHGKANYNEKTRNPEWFTEDYTHVDTYQMGYDHLPHRTSGSSPCEANILRLAVRYGSNSALNDDRFTSITDMKNAFNVHGIVDGSMTDSTINISRIHTKGTLEFSPTTTEKLMSHGKIASNNLLIVRYNFGKSIVDIIGYTDSASLLSHKADPRSVTVILGSFILKQNDLGQPVAFFEFNQQII